MFPFCVFLNCACGCVASRDRNGSDEGKLVTCSDSVVGSGPRADSGWLDYPWPHLNSGPQLILPQNLNTTSTNLSIPFIRCSC